MHKPFIFLLLLAILATNSSFGQITVSQVNESSGQAVCDGSFYVLPQTILRIDVLLRADEKMKGPYSDYAKRFLGLKNVNDFDFTEYAIEKVEITSFNEPDPAQLYFVAMGERDSKMVQTLKLEVDDSGFLVGASDLGVGDVDPQEQSHEVIIFDKPSPGLGDHGFFVSKQVNIKTDTIIRRVAVDTAMTEQYFYRMRLEDKSSEQMALSVLHEIEEIRESKFKLLTGFQETAYESASIAYMCKELSDLENEYLDLFRGKSSREYFQYTYYVTPENKGKKNVTNLFQFSVGAGVSNGGSGQSVQIELTPNGLDRAGAQSPENALGNGIAYRLPGFAIAKVKVGDKVIFEDRFRVNQFGLIRRLPAQKFNAAFYPETGGLKSVLFE